VRGFIYAGTPTVLASLWPVPNDATIELMKAFYSNLLDKGLDKANSLRFAQLEVRKKFPHVFEWAGFTIIGDWL
jgi:CHAT domain-containing protein